MECVYCTGSTRVVNSRRQKKTSSIWRRRACRSCSSIFTTLEKPALDQALRVVNGSGGLSPFDNNQLFVDIYLSLGHRRNPVQDAGAITNTVIMKLLKEVKNATVSSSSIKQLTATTLKNFDKAAFVQYVAFYPA